MANLPTYHQDSATKTTRAAELPNADFDGGVNKGGSCACGIGINTGDVDPKLDDWSLLDQAGAARDPQDSQHIGGDGLGAGNTANEPIKAVQGADVNDTLSYVTASVTAADGVGVGVANADPINRTGKTVQAGERLWGTNTVA